MANSSRLVLHCYNSKQKLMVQGQNYEKFALNCLEPFFKEKIDETIEQIYKINDGVKESFGMKRDVNIEKSCPQCELVSSSSADLKIHIKSCHTKQSICSSKEHKVPKVLQEDLLFSALDDHKIGIEETKKDKITEEGHDCKWESCTYTARNKSDLQKYFEDEQG